MTDEKSSWNGSLPARRRALKIVAATPLACLLADMKLSASAASALDDVSLTLPSGRAVKAALAMPAPKSTGTPAPAVVLFHEWWGLNDQIRTVAADLASKHGYVALAVDLYGGKIAASPDEARRLMTSVDPAQALETSKGWLRWLRDQPFTGPGVGTVGWCFGGGWSLTASMAAPVEATVIYYGNVEHTADELKSLSGPVLGHFAREDQWINAEMVAGFEHAMEAAGKQLTVHWYDAAHAFANPTGARYDAADAALAWDRTLAFFSGNLGS